MNKKEIKLLDEQVNCHFLPFVRKPSRYIGGEINQIKKDLAKCELTIALCFPDVYEIGMSNLGIRIIYGLLNEYPDLVCERVFSPAEDLEKHLREKGEKLFSLP